MKRLVVAASFPDMITDEDNNRVAYTVRTTIEGLTSAHRLAICYNACAGIDNPEDLRRQRDELQEKVEDALVALGEIAWSNNQTWMRDRANVAVAKIKGAA